MRTAALVAWLGLALVPKAALAARDAYDVRAARVSLFSDILHVVARGDATVRFGEGVRGHADAADVDLRANRVILAGHASLERAGERLDADAIVVDLDGRRVDALDAVAGSTSGPLSLVARKPAPLDPDVIAFPDVDEGRAFIRSRRAIVTPHAAVRFAPAAFPTSVGGVPVPSYLFAFAVGTGYGAQSLSGATFDQPYPLVGTPHSLTSVHARYIDGIGGALALDEHLVGSDDAYVVGSVDALNRSAARSTAISGYRRLGSSTVTVDGAGNAYASTGHLGLATTVRRTGGARLDYTIASVGSSSLDLTLRTADRPLLFGSTWRARGGYGFDAGAGGVIAAIPDHASYGTVWRTTLGVSAASPVVHGPFHTTLGGLVDLSRVRYAYPHTRDQLTANASASRTLARNLNGTLTYSALWAADDYARGQRLFYPAPSVTYRAPDGTLWPGFAAYDGATTSRGLSLDLSFTPGPDTALRVSLRTTNDFPQYGGYGRPPQELRFDARFRPFPNIGIAVGRSYDFDWNGARWVPRWSFSILP